MESTKSFSLTKGMVKALLLGTLALSSVKGAMLNSMAVVPPTEPMMLAQEQAWVNN